MQTGAARSTGPSGTQQASPRPGQSRGPIGGKQAPSWPLWAAGIVCPTGQCQGPPDSLFGDLATSLCSRLLQEQPRLVGQLQASTPKARPTEGGGAACPPPAPASTETGANGRENEGTAQTTVHVTVTGGLTRAPGPLCSRRPSRPAESRWLSRGSRDWKTGHVRTWGERRPRKQGRWAGQGDRRGSGPLLAAGETLPGS